MKYIIDICYDGSSFEGYQTQPHGKTVQDNLEKALKKIFKTEIKTIASSRTDSGVHAHTQLVMFESNFTIKCENLKKALNCTINDGIFVKSVVENMSNSHVRYDVKNKTYQYIITNDLSPFRRNFTYYIPQILDIKVMQEEAQKLVGFHNFKSFCGSKSAVTSYEREIYSVNIERVNNDVLIYVNGSGFLYNMVRIIVFTLIEIGRGKSIDICRIIEQRDRTKAPPTAPAQGLYLFEINM